MRNRIKTITQLADEWYKLIGKDHHKDRDCHFYINTVWSYGQGPVYRVEHYGYIVDEIEVDFHSYDEATAFLEKKLKEIIKKEMCAQEHECQESFDFLRE
jgi:hypothetical protein